MVPLAVVVLALVALRRSAALAPQIQGARPVALAKTEGVVLSRRARLDAPALLSLAIQPERIS